MTTPEMSEPYFSIITPTYNRAWCIQRAIKSVLSQNFKNWELIIVDDGSTDNTKGIVEKYLTDSRIKYFYKENGGVGSARNYGIENICGEIVLFLDSDDEFVDEKAFDVVLNAIRKNNDPCVGVFIFGALNQLGKSTCKIYANDFIVGYEEVISGIAWQGEPFACVKLNFLNKNPQIRFEEDINGGEGIFWLNLAKKVKVFLCESAVRIYYVGADDALTSNFLNVNKANNIIDVDKRVIGYFGQDLKKYNKKQYASLNYAIARMMSLLGLRMESTKYFIEGVKYNPFNLFAIAIYVLSFFDKDFRINNYLSKVIL